MKKLIAVLLIPSILLTLSCQLVTNAGSTLRGSGIVVTESRPVSSFDRVSVCCGMHLTLTQGSIESLEIEADENLLPEIESTVTNGELVIRFKSETGSLRLLNLNPILVRVGSINLSGVDLSGGSRMETSPIQSTQLTLELSGGSLAKLPDLQADLLTVEMSGGGKLELAGNVTQQQASLSGGPAYQANNLASQTANLNLSGGSHAIIWVTDTLTVDLSGGSKVTYYGNPTINQNLSGGSELNSLGEK